VKEYIMKIGNPTDKAIGGTSGAKTESATSTKSSGRTTSLDGGVSSSAKVTLSSAATNLITTVDPTFDSDKVASVKQSIEDGSYQINPEAIADKLIANSRELLERH